MVASSFSLPATRLAVEDLDPWFVTFARAAGAAALAGFYLLAVGASQPTRAQWRRLGLVAGGAVIGLPLLTGLALVTSEAQHGAVAYAEGGVLSRDLGGARTICWALVLSTPVTLPIAAISAATTSCTPDPPPGSASPTSRWSRCSSGSSPGTRGWRAAAWRRSARSSCCSRC